ncbi:hypothetical protein PIB30_029079 [Stylosanthes scabra]|uniref:Uncharacterized protein n=1 Tax=Stylosanthes scabra TaxID=79078 RepID=A0ABU6SBC3_9FABA|nr:hypothetical protein [Stylosanthes scabra]
MLAVKEGIRVRRGLLRRAKSGEAEREGATTSNAFSQEDRGRHVGPPAVGSAPTTRVTTVAWAVGTTVPMVALVDGMFWTLWAENEGATNPRIFFSQTIGRRAREPPRQ